LALGVTPLRVGQEAYWLDQIARDRCEYYSACGESPGWWAGALAERAGLTGVASDQAVHRLFAGQDPTTGEQRVAPLWRADSRSRLDAAPLLAELRKEAASRGVEFADLAKGRVRLRQQLTALSRSHKVPAKTAERLCRTVLGRDVRELYGHAYDQALKHADKRVDARVAAFDLSFSDVKSVSLLAAGGTPEVRRQIQAARHAAIRAVLAYLEREAVGVRRGHNGTEYHRGAGLVGAAFDHRTSREGDPQCHTHVLVQNATVGPDGRWTALDSKLLHAHAMTADRLYHAALRAELTERLDVRWRDVNPRTGAAEIDGLHDPALLRAFSKRRAQVVAQQAEWGHHGIRAAKAAALATRKPKPHPESEETFYQRVARRLAEHGIGPAELEAVQRGGRAQAAERAAADPAAVLGWLAGPDGLTAQASTFARRDVLNALAKRLPVIGTASEALQQLEQVADAFLASERAVPITIDLGFHEQRWSTSELLALEQRIIRTAEARASERSAVVPRGQVEAALTARPGLDTDQQAMVRQLTQDGAGVSLVVGYAGSGKTTATGAAVDAFRRAGIRVIPTAPTGVAAHQLERETNLPAPTVDALLGQLDRRQERLDPRTVVILDEAAMLGTRKLARLMTHASRAHAKLVMIGDDKQLASIDTGGAFRALRQRLGASELRGNHRQQTRLGREVSLLFRTGRQQEALDRLVEHGKVIVCRTQAEANAAQVADWWQRFSAGQRATMIAFTHAETTSLNAAAHQLMLQAGRLGDQTLIVDDREFREGDHIVCGRNARKRLDIVNGTRATVIALDPERRTLTIRTDNDQVVTLPAWYVAGRSFDRPWVDHAYAITGHKTQALTGDDFSVRPSTRADAQWAYVTATRHRFDFRLYLVEEPQASDDDTRHTSLRDRDPIQTTVRAMQRSGEQLFALDEQVEAEIRQMRTTDLRRERDRLRDLLGGLPPSATAHRIALLTQQQWQVESQPRQAAAHPTPGRRGPQLSDRTRSSGQPTDAQLRQAAADQAAAHLTQLRHQQQQRAAFLERHAPGTSRYLAIIEELGWRRHAHACALEIGQPGYLVNALGPVPETSRGRRSWQAAATQIDSYRRRYGISNPDEALGLEPQGDLLRRKAWRSCREAIDYHWQDERQGQALPGADHQDRQREPAWLARLF
jgi:conjugative relaxase-like TrwC/TraI family protein